MDELLELRNHITQGRYTEALLLIDELDEMSKEDKFHKIGSFTTILLLHLIKRAAEGRTTKSWDVSVFWRVENPVRVFETTPHRQLQRTVN